MLKRSRTVFDEGVRGPHAVRASSIIDQPANSESNVTISHDGVYRIAIGNNQDDDMSIDGEVEVATEAEGEANIFQ